MRRLMALLRPMVLWAMCGVTCSWRLAATHARVCVQLWGSCPRDLQSAIPDMNGTATVARILFALSSALFFQAMPALAQDNYEIQVYGSQTVEPGKTMLELHSSDRQVILMRFFQGQRFGEMGRILGASEDAHA